MAQDILVGQIVEDSDALDIEQLCRFCSADRQFIVELLEQGVIESPTGERRFAGHSLRRARLAMRLHRDLGVNAAGSALVIELLERIEVLEGRFSLRGEPG